MIYPDAWPLLPQLPFLRRLSASFDVTMTGDRTTLLSTSLSGCRALTDLSFVFLDFVDDEGRDITEEQQQARWTGVLDSVPQLQRFDIQVQGAFPLLAVLPQHLPQLRFLKLGVGLTEASDVSARLAHPTVQELELQFLRGIPFDGAPLQQLLHSPRMPQLTRCKCL